MRTWEPEAPYPDTLVTHVMPHYISKRHFYTIRSFGIQLYRVQAQINCEYNRGTKTQMLEQ